LFLPYSFSVPYLIFHSISRRLDCYNTHPKNHFHYVDKKIVRPDQFDAFSPFEQLDHTSIQADHEQWFHELEGDFSAPELQEDSLLGLPFHAKPDFCLVRPHVVEEIKGEMEVAEKNVHGKKGQEEKNDMLLDSGVDSASHDFLPFDSLFPQSELDAVEDYFFQRVSPSTEPQRDGFLVPEACEQGARRRPIPEALPQQTLLDTVSIGPFSVPVLQPSYASLIVVPTESHKFAMSFNEPEEEPEKKRRRRRRDDECWEEDDGECEEDLTCMKAKCELKSKVAKRRTRTNKGTFIKQQPFKTQEELDMESSDEDY
jgi:hypothetical protein